MKRVSYWLSAAAMGAMMMPGVAVRSHAASVGSSLRTGTLNNPDDLTIDSNTGLEFLDIPATANLSVNQALQSSFVTQQGFRFGTFDEFKQLLTDAGFPKTNGEFNSNFNTEAEPAAENLLNNFLGETVGPKANFELGNTGVTISDGFYAFVTGAPGVDPGNNDVVGVDYQSAALGQAPQDQARVTLNFNQFGPDFSSPIAGTLLVRQTPATVPVPSSLLMGGLGLGLMAVVRRRRGQRLTGAAA